LVISAAAAGAFIDRMVETKGLDYVDKKKAEHAGMSHIASNRYTISNDSHYPLLAKEHTEVIVADDY
jgi:hypothetical protein